MSGIARTSGRKLKRTTERRLAARGCDQDERTMLRGGNWELERKHKHGNRHRKADDSNQIANTHGQLAVVCTRLTLHAIRTCDIHALFWSSDQMLVEAKCQHVGTREKEKEEHGGHT
jgi:hypothetical protein